MIRLVKTAIAVLGGVAIGAGTMQAQTKPFAYVIAEINVNDLDRYTKEFLPARAKAIQEAGGVFIARGGEPRAVAGDPPPQRMAIIQFENMDKLIAFTQSAGFKDTQAIGEKYANIRIYGVEGVPK